MDMNDPETWATWNPEAEEGDDAGAAAGAAGASGAAGAAAGAAAAAAGGGGGGPSNNDDSTTDWPATVNPEVMDILECTVCTELLLDPVTTSCGHTFCRAWQVPGPCTPHTAI